MLENGLLICKSFEYNFPLPERMTEADQPLIPTITEAALEAVVGILKSF